MRLEEALYDSRRVVIDQAVDLVNKDKKLFKECLDLALSNKYQYANRATRVVILCIEKDFSLIEPYISDVVFSLKRISIDIVLGCFLKIFAEMYLPKNDEELGILAEIAFDHVQRISNLATPKIYSLAILYRISELEPELKPELISIIEDQMPKSLVSFQTRGKKMLKKLYKEIESPRS